MEVNDKLKPVIDLTKYSKDEYLVELGDYELVLKNGKYYFVRKKPQLPKTYNECCKVLNKMTSFSFEGLSLKEVERYKPFIELRRCRDAYLKIAGETNKGDIDYVICNVRGTIISTNIPISAYNHILAFPTEEMRDAFYENFKELIEQCKELL